MHNNRNNINKPPQKFVRMVLFVGDEMDFPSQFCFPLRCIAIPSHVRITTTLGEWHIKMERDNDGIITLTEGWPAFAQRHCLTAGDVIEFEHCTNFHFHCSFFDITAMEKGFEAESKHGEEDSDNEGSDLEDNAYSGFKVTSFVLRIARGASTRPGKSKLVLTDPHGREWDVGLQISRAERYRLGNRGRMADGWKRFYYGNKLKVGDTCYFNLQSDGPSDTMAAHLQVRILHARR